MKCPNKKAGLPDLGPFPHEYAPQAEYLLKMMEYNMRVYMQGMITAAYKTDRKSLVTPRMVLMYAMQKECERVALEVKESLDNEVSVAALLRDLDIPTGE